MKLLVFLLVLGFSSGEYLVHNSTCFNGPTLTSSLFRHSLSSKVANSTTTSLLFPTSPSLRSPIPMWENKTSSSCSHAPMPTPSLSPPERENGTSATRNASLPTATPEFYSAGWSLRDCGNIMIWQTTLISLFIIPLSIAS